MKKISTLWAILLLTVVSCTSSNHWRDGLSSYRESHDANLSVEILRISSAGDTGAVDYRVRIRPRAKNEAYSGQQVHLNYGMDSCFFLRSGDKKINAAFVQAIPDGIQGCFEYLLSFPVNETAKIRPLSLVYQDRAAGGKAYILPLNKQ